jgi:hypothetical protein
MDINKVLAHARGVWDAISNPEWTAEVQARFAGHEEGLLQELSADAELLPDNSNCYVQDTVGAPGIVHVRVLSDAPDYARSYDIEIDLNRGTVGKLS